MTRQHDDHFVYPAEKARQGQITLDTRRKRVIFATGLGSAVLALLLTPLIIAAL